MVLSPFHCRLPLPTRLTFTPADILGDQILAQVLEKVKKANFFTLLADEARDSSNWEQMTVVLRYVDSNDRIREDFMGFIKCESTTGLALYEKLQQQLADWGLDYHNMRGQGYDGAGNMAGTVRGVKIRFLNKNNKALYFYCASHCLSLCIVKACNLPHVKTMMGNLRELSLFFSNSSKRQRKLEEVI